MAKLAQDDALNIISYCNLIRVLGLELPPQILCSMGHILKTVVSYNWMRGSKGTTDPARTGSFLDTACCSVIQDQTRNGMILNNLTKRFIAVLMGCSQKHLKPN